MKVDDEGIPFHILLTTGTHRGDRISRRKMQVRVCSVPGGSAPVPGGSSPVPGGALQERGGAAGGKAGRGKGRRAGGAGRAHRELATFWWRVKVQEEGAALAGAGRASLLAMQGEARRWAGPGRAGTRAGGYSAGGTHGRGKSRRRKCRGKGRAGKARTGEKEGQRSWRRRSSRRRDAALGEARAGVVGSNRGTRRGERGNSKEKGCGYIGARRPEIWQAASRRRIGMELVPKSRLPTGGETGLTSGSHNLASKERIEEVTERENEIDRASSVMCRNRFG
jgi:hypothetical protein